MISLSLRTKSVVYPIIYWLVLFIFPFYIIFPIFIKDGGWVILYLLILPFIFFLPYKLAKLDKNKDKFIFLFFGFIVPFVIFYFYLFLKFKEEFHPGF